VFSAQETPFILLVKLIFAPEKASHLLFRINLTNVIMIKKYEPYWPFNSGTVL